MSLIETTVYDLPVLACVIVVIWASIRADKLTIPAAICGGIIGLILYLASGLCGFALLVIFFTLGTGASIWKSKEKSPFKANDDLAVKRDIGQVLANAGIPAGIALLIFVFPEHKYILQLMIAASFSAATADTLSSELGMLYGRRFYRITNFKQGVKGQDGVVSLEGTLFGIAGSLCIALIFISFQENNAGTFLTIIIAGTVGNLCDSLLGATLERKKYLNNNMVNLLNTLSGAITAALLTKV